MSENDPSKPPSQSVTPGWNDPPSLTFNVEKPLSTRTKLNRRVPFPLSSPTNAPHAATQRFDDIPVSPVRRRTVENPVVQSGERVPIVLDSEQMLNSVLESFNTILESSANSDDVQKRINIMITMWKELKFSTDMQRSILLLSQSLTNDSIKEANNAQILLMTKYANLCSPWMAAVRQLIKIVEAKDRNISASATRS